MLDGSSYGQWTTAAMEVSYAEVLKNEAKIKEKAVMKTKHLNKHLHLNSIYVGFLQLKLQQQPFLLPCRRRRGRWRGGTHLDLVLKEAL